MTIDYSKFDAIEDSDDEKPNAKASEETKKGPVAEKPHCHNCHKDVQKPLRCGVCKKVEYCSAKCQKEDWTFHKRLCKKPEEPKPKAAPEQKKVEAKKDEAKKEARKEAAKKREEEEKITENDEDLKWYRHREWKPTEEPKKEFRPSVLSAEEASKVSEPATQDGSVWNKAGTWEDKDVTDFALSGLKQKLAAFRNVDAAGGNLSAEDVEKVEGEASKPVIRGKRRHMFDLSFTLKFCFKWMDADGQRNAQGKIEVGDFTNDTFAEGVLTEPCMQLSFKDSRLLDAGRRQAVQAALGASSWPPQAGTLLADVAEKMEAWAKEYDQAG